MATSIMMVLLILHPCLSKLCMVYRFIATMFVVILFFFSIHHLITVLRHYHYRYTENFTVFGSDVPCLADCYLGCGNGCTYLENWLSYAGAVSVEQYCTQKWSKIDYAYGALRSCAAKAIAEPADGTTKEEYVEHNQANQNSSNACAYEIWVNDCKALKAKQQVQ